MAKLTVTFLGTSAAVPTAMRGLPAVAVKREGEVILMDCGEGVQRRVLSEGIGLSGDMAILVTHLHGDHVAGLLGLLQTMSLAQRKRPLYVVAPANLLKWLEVTANLLNVGLTFPINFVAAKPGLVLHTTGFKVRASRANHSVEAFAYVVEEHRRPGVFHPDKAKALGVPEGRLWSKLQRGRAISIGGQKILPSEVMGLPRQGRKIGYSGDTRPSKGLVRFFSGCDLLIFDSTFREGDREKAVERKHSTSVEAARVALDSRCKELALTHFSARYPSTTGLLREAREVFPRTVAARDGLRIDIPYPG